MILPNKFRGGSINKNPIITHGREGLGSICDEILHNAKNYAYVLAQHGPVRILFKDGKPVNQEQV